jgi:hypothetical protein
MRRLLLLIALAACALAPSALADGLPVLGVDVGSSGVAVPGAPDRYVTVNEGTVTLVERIARDGGGLRGLARVAGTFTIPAVAYDSSASGLSADGRSLILIEPRVSFPRQMTRFVLLDARTLHVRRTITLRGDFSFDAVSPHARSMFLVNYTSPNDPTRYTVRGYDLEKGALLPAAVRDPAERSDKMRGSPITRVMSADGRWAYTLYDGAGSTPFVHALDTVGLRAHCIDLPMLAGRRDLWALRFTLTRGAQLRVGTPGAEVAQIDLASYRASVPAPHDSAQLPSWLFVAGALGAAAALLAVGLPFARRRVRSSPAPA